MNAKKLLLIVIALLSGQSGSTLADENLLRPLAHGALLATQAQSAKRVVVLVFTSEDCPYCEGLKQDILEPTLKSREFQTDWLIREIDIESDDDIIWLDGKTRSGAQIAHRFGVFAVPTMVFLDHNGDALAKEILGYQTPEFFPYYLQQAVLESRRLLLAR